MSTWKDVHKGAGNGSELGAVERVHGDFAASRTIMEVLTGFDGEKGSKLTPCKLTLFYEMGHVKCCVNDPVRSRVGFVTLAPHEDGLLASLEDALLSGVEWRKGPDEGKSGYRR